MIFRKIDFSKRAERKKAVFWHITGGWLSNLIFIIQGLLLIPLYLYYLGDRLYGFWLATGGVLAWISMVDVGASAVTLQRSAAAFGRKDLAGVTSYFWHGAVVMAGVLTTFMMAVFVIGLCLPSILDIDPIYSRLIVRCFYVMGIAAILHLANDFMRNFASALQRNQIPVFAQTLADLLGLIGIVLSLIIFEIGLWALVVGPLIRTLIPFIINLLHTAQILRSTGHPNRWSSVVFKDYLSTTPAILAAKASGHFAQHLPVVLIARFIGPEATVAYIVTIRVVKMVQSFINHALAGLYAACSHYFNDPVVSREHQSQMVGRLARGYFVAAGIGVLLYALFNHGFIALWTSEAQFAGQLFTGLFALACFIELRNNFFVGLGVSLGAIRAVEFTQFFEKTFQACMIVLGLYSFGLIGVPLAMITAGLAAQFWYTHIFRRKDIFIAKSLSPLLWQWMPLALLLWPFHVGSAFFVVDTWLRFLVYTVCVGGGFGLLFLFFMPGLKGKIFKMVRQSPYLPQAVKSIH
jgi:uncharacterized membrane protein